MILVLQQYSLSQYDIISINDQVNDTGCKAIRLLTIIYDTNLDTGPTSCF